MTKLNLSIYNDCYMLALIPNLIGKHNGGKQTHTIDTLASFCFAIGRENPEIEITTATDQNTLLIYESGELVLSIEEREIIGVLDSNEEEDFSDEVPTIFTQRNYQ